MSIKVRASLWMLAGLGLAIAIFQYGMAEKDERLTWPLYEGLVTATKVTRAPMAVDYYDLYIEFKVTPKNSDPFTTSLVQSGQKGALEKRAQRYLDSPTWIEIRVNPTTGSAVINPEQNHIGLYILALLAFVFVGGNGLTLLFSREKKR